MCFQFSSIYGPEETGSDRVAGWCTKDRPVSSSSEPTSLMTCSELTSNNCRGHGCAYWNEECSDRCRQHMNMKINAGVVIGTSEFDTYSDCADECLQTQECMAFQFNTISGECYLWRSFETMVSDDNYVCGVCFQSPAAPKSEEAEDSIFGIDMQIALLGIIVIALLILLCLVWLFFCRTSADEKSNPHEKMIAIEMVSPSQNYFPSTPQTKSNSPQSVSPRHTPQGPRFADGLPRTPGSSSTPRRNPESSRQYLLQPHTQHLMVGPTNSRQHGIMFTQTPSVDLMSMDDQDTFRMQAGLGAYGPPPSRVLKSGNTQTYETNIDSETSAVHQPQSYESSIGTLATASYGPSGNVLYGSVYSTDSSSLSSMMSTSVTSDQWARQAVNAPVKREHRVFGSISTVSSYPTIPGSTFRSTVESRGFALAGGYDELDVPSSQSNSGGLNSSSITRNYNSPLDVDSLRQRIPSVATLKSDAFLQIDGTDGVGKHEEHSAENMSPGSPFSERMRAGTFGTVQSAATLTSQMIDQSYAYTSPSHSGPSAGSTYPSEDARFRLQSAATLKSDAFMEYPEVVSHDAYLNAHPVGGRQQVIRQEPVSPPANVPSIPMATFPTTPVQHLPHSPPLSKSPHSGDFPEVPKKPDDSAPKQLQFPHHNVPLESPDAAQKQQFSGITLISATPVTPIQHAWSAKDPEVSSVLSGEIPDLPPEKAANAGKAADFGGAEFAHGGGADGAEEVYDTEKAYAASKHNDINEHAPTVSKLMDILDTSTL